MWRSRSRAGISTTRSCGSATPCVEHQGHGRLPFTRSSNTSYPWATRRHDRWGSTTEAARSSRTNPVSPCTPDHLRHTASLKGLERAARLIADYHDAQLSFVGPADAQWRDNGRDRTGSEEVLAHNDLAPWNLIAGPRRWVYIDWHLVAPGRRHWDLAWALHSFAGLWPEAGHSDADVVRRIIAFCDGARVEQTERPALLRAVVERTAHNAAELVRRSESGDPAYQRMVNDGHALLWSGWGDLNSRPLDPQ